MKKNILLLFMLFFIYSCFNDKGGLYNENNLENISLEVNKDEKKDLLNKKDIEVVLEIEKKYISNLDIFGYVNDLFEYNNKKNIIMLNDYSRNSIKQEIEGKKKDDFEHSGKFIYDFYSNIGFEKSTYEQCKDFIKNNGIENVIFKKDNIFYSNFIKSYYLTNIGDKPSFGGLKIGYSLLFSHLNNYNNIESFSDLFLCDKNKSNYESCMQRKKIISKGNLSEIKRIIEEKKKNDNILYLYLAYKTLIIDEKQFIQELCK